MLLICQIKFTLPKLAIFHRDRKKPEIFRKLETFLTNYSILFIVIISLEFLTMIVFFFYYSKIIYLKKYVETNIHQNPVAGDEEGNLLII